MAIKDFTANVISATKVVPDGNFKDSKASGIWDINEALDLIKGGNWPNAANINPASFVDALFQTHLYNGNEGTQTITNNVDLTKGGLVWLKRRDSTQDHGLFDTERGVGKYLQSNGTDAESSQSTSLTSFNSDGFTLGSFNLFNDESTREYVSWTWRKQPKFFDIQTWTGTGSARTISHNLGSVPGMIIVKAVSGSALNGVSNWTIYHRGLDASNPEQYRLYLDTTAARVDQTNPWNDTAPTSSVFTIGTDSYLNANGDSYIAYIFAHNDDDGGFGEPGDQDIIKCGRYTGNNSTTGPVIDLGFEPQWIFIKHIDAGAGGGESSFIFDNMRGVVTGGNDNSLSPNASNDEQTSADSLEFNSSGFQLKRANSSVNGDGNNYIYMAIRRGGMQTPTAASSVFSIHNEDNEPNSSELNLGNTHVIDMVLSANRYDAGTTYRYLTDRLRGDDALLLTSGNNAESTGSNYIEFDRNTGNAIPAGGFGNNSGGTSADSVFWMWKRARGYFDVVTTKSTNGNVNHNLGVAPEMVWYKRRDSADDWFVCTATDGFLKLNETSRNAGYGNGSYLTNAYGAQVTTTTVHTGYNFIGATTADMIIYLFATCSGVSKVGSYTGTGSSQNIDCGFTAGSSFVLVKRYDGVDSWYVADSVRGISSGQTDKIIKLNNTDAQFTESDNSADYIAPHASGFNVPANSPFNGNGDGFIFYAIAAIS